MKPTNMKIPSVPLDWQHLSLSPFEMVPISNGARLFQIQTLKPGLCSFEIVFRNGRIREHKKLVSRMTANMIQEGTQDHTASKVADMIDFHGANLSIHSDLDFTVVSMSCLQKHFEFLADFVVNLVLQPAFHEEDLQKAKFFLNSQLQHQLVEPDYVSYREFTSGIYGADSVYGYNTIPSRIEAVSREDLIQYHSENYTSDIMDVFYCGDLKSDIQKKIEQLILKFNASKNLQKHNYIVTPGAPSIRHFTIDPCEQISLKLGMRCIPKKHPDFYGMYLLNTILGDYFGSRLMKNLREDKGLTYDIHSTIDGQVHDGCFYISAELNSDQIENAVRYIHEELSILQNELIPDEELTLVRNYICGKIMRQMDGPFQTMVFIKILVSEYGSTEAFKSLLKAILEIDSEQLRSLARKYFNPESMTRITAGSGKK